MKIAIGKSYKYEYKKAYPADMNGALVIPESLSSDKSSIAYTFTKGNKVTGNGSMCRKHAESHFIEVN
jgi:hypothetical protein